MVFIHHAIHAKLLWMGVDLFFILSGFLITNVLLKAKQQDLKSYFRNFYARRFRRLLVPYAILLLMVSLLVGVSWARHWYLYLFLTNLLAVLHIPVPAAFGPLWSLSVEEQFYMVWPFVVYFLDEQKLWWAASSLVVIAPLLRGVFHRPTPWAVYMLTPFRMDLLAVGALLCLTYRNFPKWLEEKGLQVGVLCGSMGLVGLLLLSRFGISTYGNTRFGNVTVFECSLLCTLGLMLWALSGRFVKVLCWKPLMYIGQISYTFYLIHVGVLTFLGQYLSEYATAVITFLACVGYASLSWIMIEEPLLKGGDHGGQKAAPVSSTAASFATVSRS